MNIAHIQAEEAEQNDKHQQTIPSDPFMQPSTGESAKGKKIAAGEEQEALHKEDQAEDATYVEGTNIAASQPQQLLQGKKNGKIKPVPAQTQQQQQLQGKKTGKNKPVPAQQRQQMGSGKNKAYPAHVASDSPSILPTMHPSSSDVSTVSESAHTRLRFRPSATPTFPPTNKKDKNSRGKQIPATVVAATAEPTIEPTIAPTTISPVNQSPTLEPTVKIGMLLPSVPPSMHVKPTKAPKPTKHHPTSCPSSLTNDDKLHANLTADNDDYDDDDFGYNKTGAVKTDDDFDDHVSMSNKIATADVDDDEVAVKVNQGAAAVDDDETDDKEAALVKHPDHIPSPNKDGDREPAPVPTKKFSSHDLLPPIFTEAVKDGIITKEEEDAIAEEAKKLHTEFEPIVDSEADMKLIGIALSVAGAFFTAMGLVCQKDVTRKIQKEPELGPVYCNCQYLTSFLFIMIGLGSNTLMVGMLPLISIAVLSSQAFIYTTLLEQVFIKEGGFCGFSMLNLFNIGLTVTGIAIMAVFANVSDIKYSPFTLEAAVEAPISIVTTTLGLFLIVCTFCCCTPDESSIGNYDLPLVGRVFSGAILSAWYTVSLKLTLELGLFFFRNGFNAMVGKVVTEIVFLQIILFVLGIVKVRYVVSILQSYHALQFLPLYQGATYIVVASYGILYFDELNATRLNESEASLPWYLLSLTLVVVGVGSSGIKYDPHLHAITDDDVYDEAEGLLDPYNNIFKPDNRLAPSGEDMTRRSAALNRYYTDSTRGDISHNRRDRGAAMFAYRNREESSSGTFEMQSCNIILILQNTILNYFL